MSKRILASTLVVAALAASNAFASQARQQVLGTLDPLGAIGGGTHGSLQVDDDFNIFYNPAYINDYKNWATIDKTQEGGFVNNFGPVNVGFYLNRSNAVNTLTNSNYPTLFTPSTNTATAGNVYSGSAPVRPFDIIVGGDMGVKWGVGFTYASNKRAATDNSATDMRIRAGVEVADFEPFADLKISGNDKTTAAIQNKNNSFTVGTRYRFGEWAPFAAYRMDKYTAQGGGDQKSNAWGFGFARNMKVAEGSILNYGAAYWNGVFSNSLTATAVNVSGAAATAANSFAPGRRLSRSVLPINVSIETDATTWLILRAGLAYNLIDLTDNLTNTGVTTGRLGAGFKLGKATLDWTVGGGSAAGNIDSQAFDLANGLFSTASLTYNW